MKQPIALLFAVGITAFASMPALAEVQQFKASLNGKSVSPATDSAATGTADIKIDTDAKTITWTIKTTGLTGAAMAAHFHGPADPGTNAKPEIDISKSIEQGTAPITAAQIADFNAGKIYVNIHTAKFPDGEIRGQANK